MKTSFLFSAKRSLFCGMTLLAFVLSSCGGSGDKQAQGNLAEGASGDMEAYENSGVNGMEQARPTIMVIPGDMTLKQFKCLKEVKVDGASFTQRDFAKYYRDDDRARRIASFIQNKFNEQNYPLTDLEQTLKSLDTQAATDMADGLAQDAKTQLLMTAHPDIILEMEYKKSSSLTGHDYKNKNVSYTLSAIDAYSNKVVATITASNIKGESTTETIQADLDKQIPSLMADIQKYYSDILTRGRDITIRINVDANSNQNLDSESIEGDTYSDEIIDYIKSHTVKGAYKMQVNTAKELSFVNARIKLVNEDGTQYGVYDFTRDLQKYLRKNLGLSATNRSQGLGEVVLTIKGI